MPGSESKLLKGLELGCTGIITATCNVTAKIARRVYDDFNEGREQKYNKKLVDVRNAFEKYNLISALHTFYSRDEKIYKNLLPPLRHLNKIDEQHLFEILDNLNFSFNSQKVA